MRFVTLCAVLLLYFVLPQSLGWAISKRTPYEDEVKVSSLAKQVKEAFNITRNGQLGARHLLKRASIALPKGAGGKVDPGEGPSERPATESGGSAGEGREGSNAEDDGGERESSEPDPNTIILPVGTIAGIRTPPVLPRTVVARIPTGLDAAGMTYWNQLDTHPLTTFLPTDQYMFWNAVRRANVFDLRSALKQLQPDIEFTPSFMTPDWHFRYFLPEEEEWKETTIFSIKFAEAAANHGGPIHALYPLAAGPTLHEQSLFTLAELPVLTAPGSRVTVIYRWDVDTYQTALSDHDNPRYNVIWTAGDAQIGTEIADMTNNPKPPLPVGENALDEGDEGIFKGCTCGISCPCQ